MAGQPSVVVQNKDARKDIFAILIRALAHLHMFIT